MGWRNLHHVCSAGPPRDGGWPAWLTRHQLQPGVHPGRDGEESLRNPASEDACRHIPTSLSSWQATNECFAKTIADTSCAEDRPSRGGDLVAGGGANCRRLMAPLSDYVDLFLEWRRWLA